jgi:hypothetical protein
MQITLDPSLISRKDDLIANMAVSISGISWQDGTLPADAMGVPDLSTIKRYSYPWLWTPDPDHLKPPTHLRVYWLDEAGNRTPHPSIFLEIKYPVQGPFDDDKKPIIDHQEHIFDQTAFKGNTVSLRDLFMNLSGGQKQEIHITDEGTSQQTAPGNTGFFSTAMGKLAQSLPPVNQLLNLVFFCEDQPFSIPGGDVKKFVVFPAQGEVQDHWEGSLQDREEDAAQNKAEQYVMYYPSPIARKVYCPITRIEERAVHSGPIKLRDDDLNFLGHVDLQVSDDDDIIPGLVFNLSTLLDLPVAFHRFTGDNLALIQNLPDIKPVADFLWATLRDGLAFGTLPESDQNSLLNRVVRKHCDELKGKLENLDEAGATAYWATYFNILKQITPGIQAAQQDLNNLSRWKQCIIKDLVSIKDDARLEDSIKTLIPKLEYQQGDDLENWLKTWGTFLDLVKTDHILQYRILFVQWDLLKNTGIAPLDRGPQLADTENKKLQWLEAIFSEAGEVRLLQLEAITQKYKEPILASISDYMNGKAGQIPAGCIESFRQYADARITNTGIFAPVVKNPFDQMPGMWSDFLTALDTPGAAAAGEIVSRLVEKTFVHAPPLQIRIDETLAKKSLTDDDLNDEIAGHVVVMRRAKEISVLDFEHFWRYLNWTRVTSHKRDPASGNVEELVAFKNPYLLPAFPGESAGEKIPFLAYSNEKPSFIAGHNMFETGERDKDTAPADLRYTFDNNPQQVAYALWYGYYYQFAGFVTLNSGVLPLALRLDQKVWNIPNPAPTDIVPATSYLHLRRVPISKARIQVKRLLPAGDGDLVALPVGLLPLAYELPDWKGNIAQQLPQDEDNTPAAVQAALQQEQAHYLLWDGQTALNLRLRKPTTPFWNWFAWLGKDISRHADAEDIALQALDREMKMRDDTTGHAKNDHLCDPAVENRLIVSIDKIFPEPAPVGEISIDMGPVDYLADPERILKVSIGLTTGVTPDNRLTIIAGEVIRIRVHALVKENYFGDVEPQPEQRFHYWMKKFVTFVDIADPPPADKYPGYVLTNPVEIWIEAAKKASSGAAGISTTLWNSLAVTQNKVRDVVATLDRTTANFDTLAYLSRLNVSHQIWNWNGRLDESLDLLTTGTPLDPIDGHTTDAMKWEAWSFSDRPDFSALVSETNLPARVKKGDPSIPHEIFRDRRPDETRALYYRLYVTAYWRYEKLGGDYARSYNSEKELPPTDGGQPVAHKWRRCIRLANRAERLPKPVVRFVIPLTKSIAECRDDNKITSAALLTVLDDSAFSEAGLAEQLELGIALRSAKVNDHVFKFLHAGNDPILTHYTLGPVSGVNPTETNYPRIEGPAEGEQVLVLSPKGPIGLTFDFAAQTPRLRGCGFIVDVPALKSVKMEAVPADDDNGAPADSTHELQPWAMAEIAVRRTLRPKLCQENLPIQDITSEWSAPQWVQFLPSIDSFIPNDWRKEITLKRHVTLLYRPADSKAIYIQGTMPVFDPIFEDYTQRFLIVTEKVCDIGGNPCERYMATYQILPGTAQAAYTLNGKDKPAYIAGQEGYLRILFVRNRMPQDGVQPDTSSIWERLFGSSAIGIRTRAVYSTDSTFMTTRKHTAPKSHIESSNPKI